MGQTFLDGGLPYLLLAKKVSVNHHSVLQVNDVLENIYENLHERILLLRSTVKTTVEYLSLFLF